jgi:serine/threonine protein kinase
MTHDLRAAGADEAAMSSRFVKIDPRKLEFLRIQNGWSVDRLQEEFEAQVAREENGAPGAERSPPKLRGGKRDARVTRGTVFNINKGKPVLLETARRLAAMFGIADVTRILAEGEFPDVGHPETWGANPGLMPALVDWEPERLLGVLPGCPHGFGSHLCLLRHRYVPGRLARGKLYLIDGLSTAERQLVREYLVRHGDVCNRLSGHPWFPRNVTSAPDVNNRAWWVVDEWVEGKTLAERLREAELAARDAARILRELARALHCLHEHGIVRRDLWADEILLRDGDDALILTDLELAKILEGRPTVAPQDWSGPINPLRAPEVGSPDATDPRVDLYSWGQLFVRLLSGSYPGPNPTPSDFEGLGIPSVLREQLASCVAAPRSKRPQSFVPVLAALEKWRPK